jgi:hypothetical protein
MAGGTFGPDAAGLDRSAKRWRERNPGRGERVVVRARTSAPGHRRAGARPRPTASQHDQAAAASAHAHRSPTSAPHNGQCQHARYSAQIGTARVLHNLPYHSARAKPTGRARTHRAVEPSCTPAAQGRTGRFHRDVPGARPPAGTPARFMSPGWRPSPGFPCSGRQPGRPGIRLRAPAAFGRPGPGLPLTPLRRDLRSAPPPGVTGPVRHARRTRMPERHGNPGRPCRRQSVCFRYRLVMHGNESSLSRS